MACDRNTTNCKIVRGADRPPCCIEGFKNLLFYVTDLFDKHNIAYWLDYVALLGAVRNGEIIPWDSDVDIGILGADVEKICSLKDQILKDDYDFCVHQFDGPNPATSGDVVDPVKVHHIYVFCSKVNRLSLEMPIWDNVDGILNRRRWGKGERAIGKSFNISYIQPLEEVTMYGRQFKCPNNIEDFLKFRYGPNWRTPIRG